MNTQERLMAVLVGPHVSEKAALVADKHRQVVFKVLRNASKDEIRAAVELMFKVKVEGVSTAVMHGKVKRFGQNIGHRQDWKKAYVTLAEGQDIDFASGAK